MMNKFAYALLAILVQVTVNAEQAIATLTWHDSALQECVTALAFQHNWTLANQVTEIKCHGKDINIAQDLMQFPNITSLSLFNNNIKTLDLTSLTKLKSVNVARNQVREMALNGLVDLESLYIFKNRLVELDLSGLIKLTLVRAMQNELNIVVVANLPTLQKAYFFDNKLEDLSVDHLSSLTFLDVRQNPMPDELYDHYDSLEGVIISHDGNADDWK